jgi:thiamine-phosphate pyrophosphorylase
MSTILPHLYAITDRSVAGIEDVREIARRLLRVGVRCVQVREKSLPDRELLPAVEAVAEIGVSVGARVIVDDRVDVARAAGVGVHLGEEDLPASRRAACCRRG